MGDTRSRSPNQSVQTSGDITAGTANDPVTSAFVPWKTPTVKYQYIGFPAMSQATKIVVGTIVVSVILAVALILGIAMA